MRKMGWKELPPGAINPWAGNFMEVKTGSFRGGLKPVFHEEHCIHCLFCWVFCPDNAIIVKDGKVVGINYDYCKGCGICTVECPTSPKSLTMEKEELQL